MVLVIDNADQLVETGGEPVSEPLTYLFEEGIHAGLKIVLGASNPDGRAIGPILKHGMPIRLVGQVADAASARAVSGVADSQAEYLLGQGDFLAVSNGMLLPFQAAYISDYDLHLVLDQLHRQSHPIMVARPMAIRPSLEDSEEDSEQLKTFQFNSHHRRANLVLPAESETASETLLETEELFDEAEWEEIEEDEADWFEDDNEAEYSVEVWSSPGSQRIIKEKADDNWNEDEIAFDWD